ncbi:helix-turn-helix domain-containing protein [Parasphingopyxis marina]|uniref:Helix-turn-helix domain-containing protein n=1 Tax=Parasphingopyxis marina TaxID=2761622 RepID=A0A842I2Y5_9SPHN|nr:helix-turn-helix domain-containing protein [Parasphingopyxis marina]MBC2778670.1 helix-turn-helix domain-containing protein [Parasphingopyxis marina]
MSEESGEDAALFETRVGTQLREARESQGVALDEIARSTRIPLRALENIEAGNYDALPAPTYSTGFVKSYARAVGLDAEALGRAFREEIDYRPVSETVGDYFEPTDPARVPPRSLAWIAAAIALLLIAAYALWRSGLFGMDEDDRARMAAGTDAQPTAEAPPATRSAAPPARAPANGTVVLEATDTVWLRIDEGESGVRIYETEMQAGDRYEIPATARQPVIRTGRANALRVTVGGTAVDPLGPPDTIISGISLLPADLARPRPQPAPPEIDTPAGPE